MEGKIWEVGSTWYISPNMDCSLTAGTLDIPAVNGNSLNYVSTCRSAIGLVLDKIGKQGIACVPAFTCHTVVQPFIDRGFEVCVYPVNEDLLIDWIGFKNLVATTTPSVVLFHSYFGFNTIDGGSNIIEKLWAKGIIVIEDLTQTMFSTYKHINAHYYLGSIRKWMPMPDGAFIKGDLTVCDLQEDTELAKVKQIAMEAKGDYIINGVGEKAEFMSKFKEAECLLDSRNKPYRMSNVAAQIYKNCNLGEFAHARRENYNLLAIRFAKHSHLRVIKPRLPTEVVPFMMPIFIKEGRKEFQQYMAAHNIYPTVIWTCPNELRDMINISAVNIYDSILCFHCDQRYNLNDMKRVADIVDAYFYK